MDLTLIGRKSKPDKPTRLGKQTVWLMTSASCLLLADMVITTSWLSVGAVVVGAIGVSALIWQSEFDIFLKCARWFNRKYHFPSLLLLATGTLFFLQSLAEPASAQFFQSAEQWMTGQFPNAGEVIPLVFNVLRGLFILYLGISLVRVVQAARQDEDWQNLARTPLIIMIAVTMGDVLAGMIVGGGGGA
ncbi:MAG: hypothetical protein Fur006_56400 [Coleofasciculaceae cyanobacterium]